MRIKKILAVSAAALLALGAAATAGPMNAAGSKWMAPPPSTTWTVAYYPGRHEHHGHRHLGWSHPSSQGLNPAPAVAGTARGGSGYGTGLQTGRSVGFGNTPGNWHAH